MTLGEFLDTVADVPRSAEVMIRVDGIEYRVIRSAEVEQSGFCDPNFTVTLTVE